MANKNSRAQRDSSGRNQQQRSGMSGSGNRAQSRTANDWREQDRKISGGRGMDTRHAGGGRDMEDVSQDMSRYNMSEDGGRDSGRRPMGRETSNRGAMSGGRLSGGGRGHYPLDNLTYDIITILHEKSKALEAFDQYIDDANDDDIRELFEDIRDQDERAIEQLQQHLQRQLSRGRRAA